MNLDTYLRGGAETAASLAEKLGVSPVRVSHWRTGFRPVPLKFLTAIEQATDGAVTRQELRPDDWHLIWPELAEKVGAGETAKAA